MKRYILIIFIILAAIAVAVILDSPAKDSTKNLPPPATKGLEKTMLSVPKSQFVDRLNNRRSDRGLVIVKRDPRLEVKAQSLARHLGRRGSLSHAGFASRSRGWRVFGEVLYQGSPNPAPAFTAWMNSPPHKVVLLDSRVRRIGVGRIKVRGTYWWVVHVGKKS